MSREASAPFNLSGADICDMRGRHMKILDIIDKPTLIELCKPSDAVAIRHLAYRVTGESLLFTAANFLFEDWLLASLIIFYFCAVWHGFWGYAGIGHEFYHGKVFSNSNINKILYRLASYSTWNNPEFFRVSHNYHHRKTFAADDSEAINNQKWGVLPIILYIGIDFPLMFRRLFYAIINSVGLTISKGKFKRIDRKFQTNSILMIIFHFLVHFIIWKSLSTWQTNVLWFLLPFTGQFFNRLLAQSQHIGLAHLNEEGALKHSRTLLLPRLIEFLYAGMNFHAEHHLIPAIPYYKLPKLNSLLVERNLLICTDATTFFRTEIWHLIYKSSTQKK